VAGRPLAISRSAHLHHIVRIDDGQEIRWHVEPGRFGAGGAAVTATWACGLAV
jgi:hypothetical protein